MSVALGRLHVTITMSPPARRSMAAVEIPASELERSARRTMREHEVEADRTRWLLAAQRLTRW